MHEAWSSLLRPIVGPHHDSDQLATSRPASPTYRQQQPITATERVSSDALFSPVADPLWRRQPIVSQALCCNDTGGFDIELAHPLYPQYVVGSATDRVWVYNRHRRVKFNSDPTVLGSRVEKSPSAAVSPVVPTFSPDEHRAALDALSVASGSTHDKILLHDPPTPSPQPRSQNSSRASSLVRRERSIRRR